MEIILLKDVKTLGKSGQIVKVSDGYARNFIIPKGLGVEKTPKTLNDLKAKQLAEAKREQELLDEAMKLSDKIKSGSVTLSIKSGEGGRTFGSVSAKEIAAAVKTQMGFEFDKKKMVLPEPIKNIGTYHIPVKLHPQVTSELVVKVVGE